MEMHQYSTAPPPGDPQLIDQIVNQIKSQGTFDEWRRECLADVDTKPAYQNLTLRVDNAVTSFLSKQKWRPELVKNQIRENLRKHILELGLIEKGVDRIVEQVVQPKVGPLFLPAVESAIYSFLGIQKPVVKKEEKISSDICTTDASDVQNDTRKVFKPMPVSVPLHQEDDTPPPGDDQFDLEAITPSPDSFSNHRQHKLQSDAEDIHDDVSDVSMEDVSQQVPAPPKVQKEEGDLEPLERICSPISQTSSAGRSSNEKVENRPKARPGSALSVISSGEDLPSSAASPVTSPEDAAAVAATSPLPVDSADEDGESDDSSDEFSSPEFEKLDVIPLSRSVGDIELEDTDSKLVPPGEEVNEEELKPDDQDVCKQIGDGTRSDRKPDEDEGEEGSRTQRAVSSKGTTALAQQEAKSEGQTVQETNSSSTAHGADAEAAQEAVDLDLNSRPPGPDAAEAHGSCEKSERSPVSKSRSRTDSHKSDRRDKSSSSSSRKDKKRSDRDKDRDRDKERSREKDRERSRSERHHSDSKSEHRSSKHKSDRSDRDKSKKSSSHKSDRDRSREKHRDRDRDRERDRERDRDRKRRDSERSDRKSDSRKTESSKSGSASRNPEATLNPPVQPSAHPKAHLWKRPTEKPKLLEYLVQFPDEVLSDSYSGYLTDVSISSVSSHDDSDYEEVTTIALSEVEVDSEVEEAILSSGGRIVDLAAGSNDTMDPTKFEAEDRHGDGGDNKRVRKLNTRYNDSFVGSEWRKMESIIANHPAPAGVPPIRVTLNNNPAKRKADVDFDSCVSGSSPDDGESLAHEAVVPSTAKKLKSNHEPPSSPESVRSNELPICDADTLVDQSLVKEDAKNNSPVGPSPRPCRRSNGLKQPQQRYSDADLYKPRPVITPSSRRSRPSSQTTP